MKDKHILITGATSGIGRETARALANLGARITFTGRNREKDLEVQKEFRRETGNPRIDYFYCDLASPASVTAFTDAFSQANSALDILINNAGIWTPRRVLTPEGIESHLAVNHLAPFLMTMKLMPLLERPATARIINVTSGIHFRGKLDLEDLEFEKRRWSSINAYTQSKLCNILFTRQLARKTTGTNICVNCLAPGWVNTGLFRDAGPFVRITVNLFAMRPAKASRSLVYMATSGALEHVSGEYFKGMQIRKSSAATYDQGLAEKLWKKSEEYLKDYL